ncbi:cobyrinic acid a,c-diamide synthase [Tamaricihabitans halophyticus]|uniref:Hydrogenobyrinate a,c-diamide synthase n=1 Tax=Tamaricihabitans halophyticus TaxID=1262583 RepID=A0A4R2QMK6_9PSEU|nr:cobyrinate a,c-diamide synthase [Tamaricihabitans halophyticus]TCP50790.1 cobyrinic acid a,c-diamide synthase [Tamaricihabitans halophyticus]
MVARLVIAAPASGSGKTTVATGLMAALRQAGRRVAPFKVGPDYIDPSYHTLATGRAGRNLDPVLVGEQRVGPLFMHGGADADIAIVEGVMGMFDGRAASGEFGSTAHLAKLIDAPVVLVVDASGQARSLAALIHGFQSFDPAVRVAGVIANKVGSAAHARLLSEACAETGLPLLGTLFRGGRLELPSRHLGLVTAPEQGSQATTAVSAMAELVRAEVDLAAVERVAASAPELSVPAWDPGDAVADTGHRPVIGVAGGAAFTFGYAEHPELLRAAGAEVAVFDPLRAERLPEGTAGVVLPGGFPEEHAAELSANATLRADIADLARAGRPIHAECGGLLYLGRELDGLPMCGVLDSTATMSDRLALGYREAVAPTDSVLYPAGSRVAGHEFHRTLVEPAHGSTPAWYWRDGVGQQITEGFVTGRVHASYLHTHPVGAPSAVARFVEECAR